MWTICHTRRFGFPKSQFCASEVVRILLFCLTFFFNLVACVLVVFWFYFGCLLAVFWFYFGCVLAVLWLCLDCITIVFSCVSCIWLKHFSAFSPPHFVSFPPLTCWRSFWLHFNCIYIWWKHFFANSPCFVSAARPACPPPPLLTSTSSPQTWRASETGVEILTDFKSQMQPVDIIAKW